MIDPGLTAPRTHPEPTPDRPEDPAAAQPAVHSDEILVLRRGPGANCSSVGSALDLLFVSAVAAGAVLAAVAAAFGPHRSPAGEPEETSPKDDNASSS